MKGRICGVSGRVCWLLVALLVPFTASTSKAEVAVDVLSDGFVHAGEFVVPINKSQVLKVDQPFTELLIGNSEIADVVALTNQSVYVLGKQLGTTNLTIYGSRGACWRCSTWSCPTTWNR